ncbi:LRR receptor-like serine/threonine-protein kinase FLS2 [Chenopodium quinoa]|uniref:LRR receptor-like serine/threonine-protein kinase FLS2 n=1 Tax=Chenopodium quinoa TaxID=63459 RepID=UPI000B770EEE|nr:LRR receptor-like serine/threonine-protein kinase FLS2 [Chenopodium quinoa]
MSSNNSVGRMSLMLCPKAQKLCDSMMGSRSISQKSSIPTSNNYYKKKFAYMRTVTAKVDIFSFGVIILEYLTAQRPTGLAEEDGLPVTLNHIVERAIAENKLLQVIDPALVSNLTENQDKVAEELLKLALFCTSSAPEQRPDIKSLLTSLKKLKVQQSRQDWQ